MVVVVVVVYLWKSVDSYIFDVVVVMAGQGPTTDDETC